MQIFSNHYSRFTLKLLGLQLAENNITFDTRIPVIAVLNRFGEAGLQVSNLQGKRFYF
jgi:hypothetical protein